MMSQAFSRTELMFGPENMARLAGARVAVFGLGGVGGYVVEALARSGVGAFDLIDNDTVSISNINRQIYALRSTVGRYKAEVAAERIRDINPEAEVTVRKVFYGPDTKDSFDFTRYDYVVDAIDTVTGKIALAVQAAGAHTPLISCMGAGNKLDPTAFQVADLSETSVCPLAKVMRRELKKRGILHLKVVYSREVPLPYAPGVAAPAPTGDGRRYLPASNAFVPSVAGLIVAGEVIRDLTFGRADFRGTGKSG